jgi:dynein heavy chain
MKLPQGTNSTWLSMRSWGELSRLSDLKSFPNFYQNFYNVDIFLGFKNLYDSLSPHEEPLPAELGD